mmetsp:Transcript_25763/g.85873  ORF Transcript_25763/g.85873 Transcript_25763/m.85873 type:complete len:209 (-) Transcript_25763:533-1159(-)
MPSSRSEAWRSSATRPASRPTRAASSSRCSSPTPPAASPPRACSPPRGSPLLAQRSRPARSRPPNRRKPESGLSSSATRPWTRQTKWARRPAPRPARTWPGRRAARPSGGAAAARRRRRPSGRRPATRRRARGPARRGAAPIREAARGLPPRCSAPTMRQKRSRRASTACSSGRWAGCSSPRRRRRWSAMWRARWTRWASSTRWSRAS